VNKISKQLEGNIQKYVGCGSKKQLEVNVKEEKTPVCGCGMAVSCALNC
jgi:hypothetical protein